MKEIKIVNHTSPLLSDLTAGWCESFWCKFKGMMFKRSIPDGWGLLFVEPRESIANTTIHMFFCFIDLGIIWLDDAGEVVDTCLAKKWVTIKAPKSPARYFLEISPSRLAEFNIGDKLDFV